MSDENEKLRARIAKLEEAIRENGKCPTCGGNGWIAEIVYLPGRKTKCADCKETGLEPWAREALEYK